MGAWREGHNRTLIACVLVLLLLGRSVGAAFGEAPFSTTGEEPGLVFALSLAVDVPTERGFTSDIDLCPPPALPQQVVVLSGRSVTVLNAPAYFASITFVPPVPSHPPKDSIAGALTP